MRVSLVNLPIRWRIVALFHLRFLAGEVLLRNLREVVASKQ